MKPRLPLLAAAALLLLAAAPRLPAQEREAAAPEAAAAEPGGDFIALNFDKVDVRVFAQIVADFTGRRIAVSEGAEGSVSVFSRPVSREEAFAVFATALEASGFTLVPEADGTQRVLRAPEREGAGMGTVVTEPALLPEHGLVTYLLRLENVSAADMRDMLEAQTRRQGKEPQTRVNKFPLLPYSLRYKCQRQTPLVLARKGRLSLTGKDQSFLKYASASENDGIPPEVASLATFMEPITVPNCTHSNRFIPCDSAFSRPAMKASPAPEVLTTGKSCGQSI